MTKTTSKIRFQNINLITIVLLFLVILAGGIVRSTGSGMGCPDWPKCLGRYIPPTSVTQLPRDYKKKYVAIRAVKNQRFAKALDFFGYGELARRIREDKSILMPEEFNAAKTWTEYVNRLVGAISGIFLLLTAVLSFSYRKENRLIPVLSILNVLVVGYQAWLGSIVVSTNLVPMIVTVHMLLALVIVALSITTYHMAKVVGKPASQGKTLIRVITIASLLLSVFQIVFGTELREKIDAVIARLQGGYREDWLSNAGAIFYQHRDVAIFVVLINIVLYALVRQGFSRHSIQQQLMSITFLLIMLQIAAGISLSYWALPPAAQALHVILASLIFGAQYYQMLNLYKSFKVQGARK